MPSAAVAFQRSTLQCLSNRRNRDDHSSNRSRRNAAIENTCIAMARHEPSWRRALSITTGNYPMRRARRVEFRDRRCVAGKNRRNPRHPRLDYLFDGSALVASVAEPEQRARDQLVLRGFRNVDDSCRLVWCS